MKILKLWIDGERGRGIGLARHLGVPASFVANMSSGLKSVPFKYGAAIEGFTDGEVSRKAMFPADWRSLWPELDTTHTPTPTPAAQTAQQGVNHA
jgi:DNA-binding transcriptional regulator YdaS (Cro superfamily)